MSLKASRYITNPERGWLFNYKFSAESFRENFQNRSAFGEVTNHGTAASWLVMYGPFFAARCSKESTNDDSIDSRHGSKLAERHRANTRDRSSRSCPRGTGSELPTSLATRRWNKTLPRRRECDRAFAPPPSPGHLLPPREINHRRHLHPGWGGWGLESYGRCLGVWVRLLRTELVLRLVHST